MLETLKGPQDVKNCSIEQLEGLAAEVREALFNRLSKKGGHFGPNFGMVEMTIALHYVFDSPKDKFVFDVSHQTYTHKMLTGRAYGYTDDTRFEEVSGYTEPNESEHDMFLIGHTSTSVSLATGLAKGRDLTGKKENIIAIIGDGSLSGGEALEGLDFAGEMDTNLIIVVNDNEQSIAENHGGLYKNLAELRESAGQASNNLFKAMGLDYIYVEAGNDIATLIKAFEGVKDIDHPIVVHVHTQKGKGYALAEQNREAWHWAMPFDRETGKPTVSFDGENYGDLTATYLLEKMAKDPAVAFVSAAVPVAFGFTKDRREQAKGQYMDVGIAEEQAVAMCSGIARNGGKPVFGTNATFAQRTYDQLAQDVCVNHTAVTVLLNSTSMMGMNDATHIGVSSFGMMSNIPGLVYMAPTSKEEYFAMLDWSIEQNQYPVAIAVPGNGVQPAHYEVASSYDDIHTFQMCKKGKKVAVLALGGFFQLGEETVATIESQLGTEVTLINPRYVSGVDEALLESLKADHDIVVTLEDGIMDGGFGQKVAAFYGDSSMKVLNYGLKKDIYDRYDCGALMTQMRLTKEQIAEDVINKLKIIN